MNAPVSPAIHAFVPDENLYPAVFELFGQRPRGKILDAPAGHGAFVQELLARGYDDIHCLDINAKDFAIKDSRVHFIQHDVINPLPYADAQFDYIFSLEGVEHFENPFVFVKELCRVLKPGGRLYLSTPNTFSVDARLKYLLSGYFPRFRPLMQNPTDVMKESVDEAHISPIYFWQLHYFLLQGGLSIERVGTNAKVYKRRWINRKIENLFAKLIRRNIRKRNFPDHGVTSEAMLFGDCIILECRKAA